MTISATSRFIDLFGDRLDHGAAIFEPSLCSNQELLPIANGKVAVIAATLYPHEVFLNPYLPGSDCDRLYVSGCAVERADLADVVKRL